MLHAMLFYLSRYIEDNREKREALREIRRNGWRCSLVVNAENARRARSYRRIYR